MKTLLMIMAGAMLTLSIHGGDLPATGLPSSARQTGRCAKLPCGSKPRAIPSPGTYGTSAKAINQSSTADWTAISLPSL